MPQRRPARRPGPGWRPSGAALRLALFICLSVLAAAQARARSDDREDGAPNPDAREERDDRIRRTPDAPDWPDDFETGLRAAMMFSAEFGLVETDSVVQRVNDLGYAVASQAGHPEILFTFHVLDVPQPNAFALPGGFLFLTRGILDLGLSDNALAHLMGHELAHVTEGHFARSDRIGTVLSLLQTAAVVATIFTVPQGNSGGYDQDPETRRWRASYGGQAATLQATQIFGGLFGELLMRGYGRNLEMEADEVGRRFAVRAGYPMQGSTELLEGLHQHVFEDDEYGYWRTHPYFADRVVRARAAGDGRGTAPGEGETAAYRSRISSQLSAIANTIRNDRPAMYLHRAALAADPDGASSFTVEHRLLQRRAERLHRQRAVLRPYGPLIAAYDSLLSRAARAPQSPDRDALPRIRSEREDLARARDEIEAESRAIIARPDAGTYFLELFLDNFPADSSASAIRYRLAEQYFLADRADDAVHHLHELLRESSTAPTDSSASGWRERSVTALHRTLREAKELTSLQELVEGSPSDSVRSWAASRLGASVAKLDSLELGSRFLRRFPESSVAPQVSARVSELAMQKYYQARVYESVQRYQEALDTYNRLLLSAPGTEAARLSREGIDRMRATAGK
ncbi:MAG: M48 family metalloprotease [Candidatus Eisenbacteria bacterium]|nr:M48 family metalloprotease [Candidatus Eisenbacteria bacterium]MCC7143829.1 M48 family metalloprotease [Candidatus Eisenbacteria bacterium]